MSENKNCPGAATPEQQAEKESFGEGTISNFQYTTNTGKIARLLSQGEKNAVPLKHLEAITGLDGRTVRRLIEQERRHGTPILSTNGYFLPATTEEKQRFIRSMKNRAAEILETVKALE